MSGGHRRITCVHCGGVGIHHGHGLLHDEHTLAAKILEQEHIAYSEAINVVLSGSYGVVGRKLVRTVTAR